MKNYSERNLNKQHHKGQKPLVHPFGIFLTLSHILPSARPTSTNVRNVCFYFCLSLFIFEMIFEGLDENFASIKSDLRMVINALTLKAQQMVTTGWHRRFEIFHIESHFLGLDELT